MTEQSKYEEWLSCITNTRLIFNTMAELEVFLDSPSIHSNGIKRCFFSLQRVRSAFRDLSCEVDELTDGCVSLKSLMIDYKKTWHFYKENLDRRSNPTNTAMELLRFHFPPFQPNKIGKKKLGIFDEIKEQGINIPLLILFLLKAFPGYDSKNGDIDNIGELFDTTLQLLDKFTECCEFYTKMPLLLSAHEEPKKTRLSLFFHVSNILHTYEAYAEQENLYEVSNSIKNGKVALNIEGFWNECGGKLMHTNFWQIQNTDDEGSYFATFWQKDADNNLTGIRYTLFLLEHADGSLIAYMTHPKAIRNRMKGLKYSDSDHVWYNADFPISNESTVLPFKRLLVSSAWKANLNLTKITDKKTQDIYESWLEKCNIVKPFKNLEYSFFPNIFAITHDAIFIPTEDDAALYKIPRNAFDGFEQIQLNDNVGLMQMDNKYYFAFDEFLLYLPVSNYTMKKYGITIVDSVG